MTNAVPALDFRRKLRIVPLPSDSALSDFSSGEERIDRHLGKCCEWHASHRSRVFCAYLADEPTLYGFYCLGLHAHEAKHAAGLFSRSTDDSRNFVPFIYINYLAVRAGWHRRKIGTMLLLNALERCAVVIRNVGAYGIALHALTDAAVALYDQNGFRARNPNDATPLMVLPAQAIIDLPRLGEFAT